jgi:hypothetical protein
MTAGMTFFLRSGFPFFTVAITISPTHAAGRRLSRPLTPFTEITYRFFAPVLSAQLTTAPTGRPRDIRNLFPEEPPRPTKMSKIIMNDQEEERNIYSELEMEVYRNNSNNTRSIGIKSSFDIKKLLNWERI